MISDPSKIEMKLRTEVEREKNPVLYDTLLDFIEQKLKSQDEHLNEVEFKLECLKDEISYMQRIK